MVKTYRRFAYRKVYGIIGRYANNLGIKDRDFQISNKGIDQNNSDRTGISVGTDFAGGYVSDRYRNGCNDFAPQKKEKIKQRMLIKDKTLSC